jgi:hypothetical protein
LNHASPFGSLIFLRKYYKRGIFENINPFQIPVWVGSDSHAGIVYGQYRMAFLTSDFSKDGIMEAIFHRKIRAYGPILPLWSWLRDGATNLIPQIKKKALKH